LKATQDQLIQSEKMASIGQLAAGVAHEINNPIGFSLSNVSTLVEYIDSIQTMDKLVIESIPSLADAKFIQAYQTRRMEEDIDFIQEDSASLLKDTISGLQRVSDIVANLKKVSHTAEVEREFCDINEVVDESLKVVWNELKYNLEVEKNYAKLPPVSCHVSEIHQVLMNMFINASHACEEGGVLTIKTYATELKQTPYIAIDISDNGKGIPQATIKKIFDPFFTTKPVGVGTGLGLSISFGIIEKHGGKIRVDSVEGDGTTFSIYLPDSAINPAD
jgi:signal transduction histidine kinase